MAVEGGLVHAGALEQVLELELLVAALGAEVEKRLAKAAYLIFSRVRHRSQSVCISQAGTGAPRGEQGAAAAPAAAQEVDDERRSGERPEGAVDGEGDRLAVRAPGILVDQIEGAHRGEDRLVQAPSGSADTRSRAPEAIAVRRSAACSWEE